MGPDVAERLSVTPMTLTSFERCRGWRSRQVTDRVVLCVAILLSAGTALAATAAEVTGTAGSYQIALHTDPAVIPVGKATLFVRVRDASGKAVAGVQVRVLAKMTDMDMGERESAAKALPDDPGLYSTPVSFAMAGVYNARVTMEGPAGPATATVALRTGQDTTPASSGKEGGGLPFSPWLLLVPVALFVAFRLWRLGVRPRRAHFLNHKLWFGLVVIGVVIAASFAVVRALKRPNSMALMDALGSDMSNMPAPPGAAPVVLAAVESASVEASIRYTGTAVGFTEQEVSSRVSGWLTWMPFYAGDRVRAGQLLAKVDTAREYESRIDERRAGRQMAQQMEGISRVEYRQALAAADQARAEGRAKEGALEEARRMHSRSQAMLKESHAELAKSRSELRAMQADQDGAQHDEAEALSMLQSVQTGEADAEAMLAAMRADQAYWVKKLARMKVLLEKGAVSGEEYQRDEAMAKGADAKVRQSEAKLRGVRSDILAARSRLERARAGIRAAQAKVSQAESGIEAFTAKTEQAQADIAAAAGKIRMTQGELDAARANARAMKAQADASFSRIAQAQSGVKGAQAALTTAKVLAGFTEIRARIDGVVTARVLSAGAIANPGQAILRVAQIQPIRLQANVAEADLIRLRLGSPMAVWGSDASGTPARARVTSIAPSVDPVTRTAVIEAIYPNRDARFVPGQFLRVALSTGRGVVTLRLPTAAIRWQSARSSATLSTQQAAYVWLAEPSGEKGSFTVRRVDIRTGAGNGDFTEVLSGLSARDQVVLRGQDSLRPGDTVKAAPWTQDGPESLPKAKPSPGAGHGGHTGGAAPPAPVNEHSTHGAKGGR